MNKETGMILGKIECEVFFLFILYWFSWNNCFWLSESVYNQVFIFFVQLSDLIYKNKTFVVDVVWNFLKVTENYCLLYNLFQRSINIHVHDLTNLQFFPLIINMIIIPFFVSTQWYENQREWFAIFVIVLPFSK